MLFSGAYYFFAFATLTTGIIQYISWHKIRNKIALAFTVVVSYQYLIYGLYFSGSLVNYPHLLHTQMPTMFLATVLGHLYYREIFDPQNRFTLKTWWHFLLPALHIVALIPEFIKPAVVKIELIESSMTSVMSFELLPWNFYAITGFLWVYNSYNLYMFLQICYKEEAIDFKRLSWRAINFRDPRVIWILWYFIHNAILIAIMILNFFSLIHFINFLMMAHIMNILILYLYTLVFPYFIQVKLLVPSGTGMSHADYVKSHLNHVNLHKVDESLMKLMQDDHLYTDPGLKIGTIAQKLEISVHQLSEFINKVKKTSFHEYINSLRLAHAADLLLNEKEISAQVAGLRSGYNSESTFFRNFKHRYHMTPTQYRKKYRSQS